MAVSSTTPNLRHRDYRPLTVVLVGLAIVALALGGFALRRTTSDDTPARTPAVTAASTGSPSLRAAGVEDVAPPSATGSPSLRAAGVEDVPAAWATGSPSLRAAGVEDETTP